MLKVSIIQNNPIWEQMPTNLAEIEKLLPNDRDLIVLPEMFSSGFSMNSSIAESMFDVTTQTLKRWAKTCKAVISGSTAIIENGSIFNRLLFVYPNGEIDFYDKRHLFSIGGENSVYSRGYKRKLISIKGYKILPSICYDIRFPVWLRNTDNYDILINIANWPKSRMTVWQTLLKARAIENQCYVIAANRCGSDPQTSYEGMSAFINQRGEVENQANNTVSVISHCIHKEKITTFRDGFPTLHDRDNFIITN
ncbi:MAG: nitrilase-related carbon-nitrogen hydrolase [Bacteroidales bacterium]